MTAHRVTAWWPPIAVSAMLLLGWAVGRGSTPLDDRFVRGVDEVAGAEPRWLLVFTDWWLLGPVLAACVAAALYRRRWRLAAVVALCPFVAIALAQAVKGLFGRRHGGYLAYPSGHTTLVITVGGMVVLVAGVRLWAVLVAILGSLLGMLGLIACGYHYLTDTIGAALLATALVCLAARIAGGPALTPAGPAGRRSAG